jgi:hypothetical protein
MARMTFGKARSGFRKDSHPVCKGCGWADKFDFSVSNDVWKEVVPLEYQSSVVCLECFDEFAFIKGVDYSIATLYFAGDQAVFEFQKVAEPLS